MASFFDDDNSRASSDNEADEDMEDLGGGDGDLGGDMDADADAEQDFENQENYDEEDQDDTQDIDDSPTRGLPRSSHLTNGKQEDPSAKSPIDARQPALDADASLSGSRRATPSRPTGVPLRPQPRLESVYAATYDIVPTIAAPQGTSINAVAATPDMRWVFSGGSDGWIRKFNWIDTVNGKTLLTVAQRQPFVDSVVKCGVLVGYWENEETLDSASAMQYTGDGPSLSPVYSLAVQHQALWLLSGTESGAINLSAVRHDEGRRVTSLYKHTSAVSVMSLSQDETSLLTGSWDKAIHDWDLNTGQVKRSYLGSGSQISTLEMRPISNVPIPRDFTEVRPPNGTLSSDNADKPRNRGSVSNGLADGNPRRQSEFGTGSPNDSLFGSNNSLFGDNDLGTEDIGASAGLNFDPEDNDLTNALGDDIREEDKVHSPSNKSAMVEPEGGPKTGERRTDDMVMAEGEKGEKKEEEKEGPATEHGATETIGQDEKPSSETAVQNEEQMEIDTQNGSVGSVEGLRRPGNQAEHSEVKEQVEGLLSRQTSLPHAEEMPDRAEENREDASTQEQTPASESTFLDSAMDGTLRIWDRRQPSPIARMAPRNTPPWCMSACWSHDGNFIYAGRRNGTVDEYSVHKGLSEPRRTLVFPAGSGAVSGVRAMPNGRHLICASYDILRLYDLKDDENTKKSTVPFLIVPGHRTGVVSQLYIDPTCTFMISTGGSRGWEGNSSEVLLGYEIGVEK